MEKAINIVSFDIPFPANYGGVIDVYYKLVGLKNAGIKIQLHCFEYGRKHAKQLEALCENVYYYKRNTGFFSHFSLLPYTVKSRQSKQLAKNLQLNNYPVLFEVLHTCFLLKDARFAGRKKIYRHSNIEHEYYKELARSETRFFKKIFLTTEAFKLKRFEKILNFADIILAVNNKDASYFIEKYPNAKTIYLPSFHQNNSVSIPEGKGEYCLYNGNLSVSENYDAVIWLIDNVFTKIDKKVIIAGLNPPEFLIKKIARYKHIQLVSSPSQAQMDELIRDAQVHVMYTKQPTGLKLKLLNVLFTGKFIVTHPNMISGTSLQGNGCLYICNTPEEFIKQIHACFTIEFNAEMLNLRLQQVQVFNNERNIKLLINTVF